MSSAAQGPALISFSLSGQYLQCSSKNGACAELRKHAMGNIVAKFSYMKKRLIYFQDTVETK